MVAGGGLTGISTTVDIARVVSRCLTITGSMMGTRGDLEAVAQLCGTANIRPNVHTVLPLERAHDGLRMVLDGAATGKVVLVL